MAAITQVRILVTAFGKFFFFCFFFFVVAIDSDLFGLYRCCFMFSRDRLVVRTLRCGRNNPGSNPGYGICVNFFSPPPFLDQINTYITFFFFFFFGTKITELQIS